MTEITDKTNNKVPDHAPGRGLTVRGAWLAPVFFGALLGVVGVIFSVDISMFYGMSLFFFIPAEVGFIVGFTLNWTARPGLGMALFCAFLSVLFAGVFILGGGLDGFLCILILLVPWIGSALLGAGIGWVVGRRVVRKRSKAIVAVIVCLLMPLLCGAEAAVRIEPPLLRVTSSIDIAAPRSDVWRHTVAFGDIPPPFEWAFRAGIAYPLRARIEGSGVGAIRYCEFSTGAFIEPITHWEEPGWLAFDVDQTPPPMIEWSPYSEVRAPHLEYFRSERGEFRLVELPGGFTRLIGTTWYRHDIWPMAYWQLWSDALIHQIHMRVLRQIKLESETDRR